MSLNTIEKSLIQRQIFKVNFNKIQEDLKFVPELLFEINEVLEELIT